MQTYFQDKLGWEVPAQVLEIKDTLNAVAVSVTERCERHCSICPHGVSFVATEDDMSIDTALVLQQRLLELNYKGRVAISGYGEPLLNKDIVAICAAIVGGLKNNNLSELITNGDMLTTNFITEIMKTGLTRIAVSVYEKSRMAELTRMFEEAGVEKYQLRKRWDTKNMEVNNRCGASYQSKQIDRVCYIPLYKMFVRPSGRVGVCDQDWTKTRTIGNIRDSNLMELWMSHEMLECRSKLVKGDRSMEPCNRCDVLGDYYTIHPASMKLHLATLAAYS